MRSLIITFSLLGIIICNISFGQSPQEILASWPAPPELKYPNKGNKNHQLDYVMVDVSDWERYIGYEKTINNEEIPARVTYYTADNELIFSTTVGIRLSGFYIRKLPQKSIAVDFGKTWESAKVNYKIWEERDYDNVDSFVIRAHGNPMHKTFFLDGLSNIAVAEHTELEYSSYRPVVMYLNGEYQGLFNIREKKNKDVLNNLYDISKKDIEIFDVVGGKNTTPNADWEALTAYLNTHDLSVQKNYDYVASQIDIDNFIDYQISETHFVNTDWPKSNVKVWRHKGGKWRFLYFDLDRAFISGNAKFNQLEHTMGNNQWMKNKPNQKPDERLMKSTLVFRKLTENDGFNAQFVIRYQDLLNTAFKEERILAMIDENEKRLESEVPAHLKYWDPKIDKESFQHIQDYDHWKRNVEGMRKFVRARSQYDRQYMDEFYNLGGFSSQAFVIEDPIGGELKINTVLIQEDYFKGEFINSRKITVTAIPKTGYRFDGWEGIKSNSMTLEFLPKDVEGAVKAKFVKL